RRRRRPVTEPAACRVLVVDDEPDITALVAYHLAKAGYRVITAATGRDALRSAREERPDLVVLDLMLPGVSGYDVLAELRRRDETKDIGVIVLTARKEPPDRIKGLELGADDYRPRPFSPQERVLRVGAGLRRLAAPAVAAGGLLVAGPITLDRTGHRVTVDGAEIELTDTEFRLLRTLIEREGRGLPVPPSRRARPGAPVRLATRLFVATSLLAAATAAALIVAADRLLRGSLEDAAARGLEREARLVAALLPADSLAWPDLARELGARLGERVTLIDPAGRVRGDTEFDRAALGRLENHLARAEVRDALARGAGRSSRLSASTNARRLYVAVRGGPPGLAVVRLSTTLAALDAQVGAVQRAVALAG